MVGHWLLVYNETYGAGVFPPHFQPFPNADMTSQYKILVHKTIDIRTTYTGLETTGERCTVDFRIFEKS